MGSAAPLAVYITINVGEGATVNLALPSAAAEGALKPP
jgi:hypothetical protein